VQSARQDDFRTGDLDLRRYPDVGVGSFALDLRRGKNAEVTRPSGHDSGLTFCSIRLSAAYLKFLYHKRRIRPGTSNRKSGTRINRLSSAHEFSEVVEGGL